MMVLGQYLQNKNKFVIITKRIYKFLTLIIKFFKFNGWVKPTTC